MVFGTGVGVLSTLEVGRFIPRDTYVVPKGFGSRYRVVGLSFGCSWVLKIR